MSRRGHRSRGWPHSARSTAIIVNYQLDQAGWTAELLAADTESDTDSGTNSDTDSESEPEVLDWLGVRPSAAAIFHAVLAKIEMVEDETDTVVSARHVLAGDPRAWLVVAEHEGFAHLLDRPIRPGP